MWAETNREVLLPIVQTGGLAVLAVLAVEFEAVIENGMIHILIIV